MKNEAKINAYEETIRQSERGIIAHNLKVIAEELLRDPHRSGIDGYCAAVVLDLSETLAKFGTFKKL